MILADRPYISDFLLNTISEENIPVIKTPEAETMMGKDHPSFIDEKAAVEKYYNGESPRLYCISENSIGWISKHLQETPLPEKLELFKDKIQFRETLQPMFPEYFFRGAVSDSIQTLDISGFPFPFIIKPSVGFFSMGVHKVSSTDEWPAVKNKILNELASTRDLYPGEVFNASRYIIEECIEGEEFAIDAWFNAEGKAVIAGIYKHLFSGTGDVSDRVYITSRVIIEENISDMTRFMNAIGKHTGIRDFPVHAEIRRNKYGKMVPIEINPMRFGGWCTTADMTARAFGFNPYISYLENTRPDWDSILASNDDSVYSLVVLDNSTGIDGKKIPSFNYERLISRFDKTIELRKVDYREYPLFGFLFLKSRPENFGEIEAILMSDLREFL